MSPTATDPLHALYAEHLDYVWNVVRKLGVDPPDAEDLAQEVFLRVVRDFPRFDASRPVRPWLCGVAAHVAIDFLRRRQAAPVALAASAAPDAASCAEGPEHAAATAQERRVLDRILGTLDLDRRAVLVMHEILGHTAAEISEALGIPLNTAYSRLRLARVDFDSAVRRFRENEVAP